MAPELTTGARDADARTDVYGLGAILYELLTGRPPFVATIPLEVVRMVREERPVPPSAINKKVPDELEAVCLRCLEKDPGQRFAAAGEVVEAVRAPAAK
jgi:serine/threonine protein kinase